jgi:hypothetical protein
MKQSLYRNFEGALYQYRVRTEFAGLWWQDRASRFGQGVKESTDRAPASLIRSPI